MTVHIKKLSNGVKIRDDKVISYKLSQSEANIINKMLYMIYYNHYLVSRI